MKRWAKVLTIFGLVFYAVSMTVGILLTNPEQFTPSVFFAALMANDYYHVLFILFHMFILFCFVLLLAGKRKSRAFFRKIFITADLVFIATQIFSFIGSLRSYIEAAHYRWIDFFSSILLELNSTVVMISFGILLLVLFDRVDSSRESSTHS